VVASEDEEVFGVFDLVREQQADGLERLLSSVDIVSKEEVVGLWGEGSVLEQTQQIVILAVDIT
jgi:phage tail sheath gpL-like